MNIPTKSKGVSSYEWKVNIYKLIMHNMCLLFLHHCREGTHFYPIFGAALKPLSNI